MDTDPQPLSHSHVDRVVEQDITCTNGRHGFSLRLRTQDGWLRVLELRRAGQAGRFSDPPLRVANFRWVTLKIPLD